MLLKILVFSFAIGVYAQDPVTEAPTNSTAPAPSPSPSPPPPSSSNMSREMALTVGMLAIVGTMAYLWGLFDRGHVLWKAFCAFEPRITTEQLYAPNVPQEMHSANDAPTEAPPPFPIYSPRTIMPALRFPGASPEAHRFSIDQAHAMRIVEIGRPQALWRLVMYLIVGGTFFPAFGMLAWHVYAAEANTSSNR